MRSPPSLLFPVEGDGRSWEGKDRPWASPAWGQGRGTRRGPSTCEAVCLRDAIGTQLRASVRVKQSKSQQIVANAGMAANQDPERHRIF